MNFVKIILPFFHFFNLTKINSHNSDNSKDLKNAKNIFGYKCILHDLDINEYKYIIL